MEGSTPQAPSGATARPAGPGRGGSGRRLVVGGTIAVVLGAGLVIGAVAGPFGAEARDPGGRAAREVAAAATAPPLRVVVALGLEPEVASRDVAGLVAHLRRSLGVEVRVEHLSTNDEAILALLGRRAEAALLPALGCVQASERDSSVRLLALLGRAGSFAEDGVLVVREENGPRSADELRGRSLCYPGRGSTTGYLAGRGWLRSHGLEPDRDLGPPRVSDGHLAALRDLSRGLCDAAATSAAVFEAARRSGRGAGSLRILARTARVPTPCAVGAPGLDERAARAVRESLLDFEPEGAAAPGSLLPLTGARAASRSSFRAVRLAARLEGLLRPPGAAAGPAPTGPETVDP